MRAHRGGGVTDSAGVEESGNVFWMLHIQLSSVSGAQQIRG